MGIKNLWSLNVDELLAADQIKHLFNKSGYEVFFPLNAQMKNIDLIFYDCKAKKAKSIQVKGSRTYGPLGSEVSKYGNGNAAWFNIDKNSILLSKDRVDYYIFVLHCLVSNEKKKDIKVEYLIIPTDDFINICSRKTLRKGGRYHFFIWVDSGDKRSFEFNNKTGDEINLDKYLNNWQLLLK